MARIATLREQVSLSAVARHVLSLVLGCWEDRDHFTDNVNEVVELSHYGTHRLLMFRILRAIDSQNSNFDQRSIAFDVALGLWPRSASDTWSLEQVATNPAQLSIVVQRLTVNEVRKGLWRVTDQLNE